jgi:enoyl-CoA hydratase/carnithine racemase
MGSLIVYTAITTTLDDQVAVVELNRPPANYFDRLLIGEVADAAQALVSQGARAIVLAAAGKHFCAGADFSGGEMAGDRAESTRALYREAARLFDIPVPVIAAVQGSAVGGGVGLACAADFRVAAPSTRFHANFAMLGFHQGFGLSVTLPQIVGPRQALDLLGAGRRITGEQALQIGLADRLVPDGEQRAEAIGWARDFAAAAPLAVQSIKRTLRGSLAAQVRAVLDHEHEEQVRLWATDDSRIGIEANLARQRPVFSGR